MKIDFLSAPASEAHSNPALKDSVIIIASWKSDSDTSMLIQDFEKDGRKFIPIFSDWAAFGEQSEGSGFEEQGIEIDRKLLASVLRGDEWLVLNPGGSEPATLDKADLEC